MFSLFSGLLISERVLGTVCDVNAEISSEKFKIWLWCTLLTHPVYIHVCVVFLLMHYITLAVAVGHHV